MVDELLHEDLSRSRAHAGDAMSKWRTRSRSLIFIDWQGVAVALRFPKRVRTLKEGGDRHMATIYDVAAYILGQHGPMTAMKLQKLCYYTYGYHLAWEERRMFPERFEAWANGPVSPELYTLHRGKFQLEAGEIAGDCNQLDDGERESVDLVLEGLGGYSAHQLSMMSHSEAPWAKARRRAGALPLQRSNEELDDAEIFEFFDALTANPIDGQA
jgi:uncharacterized phage-associated protein